MAGLIDGEGSILLTRNRPNQHRTPAISVSSTTAEIMVWLKDTFGGTISKHKVYKDNHKQSWSWKLVKREGVFTVLNGILPHLKEPRKRARALHILDGYAVVTQPNGKYSAEQLQRKLSFEESFLYL